MKYMKTNFVEGYFKNVDVEEESVERQRLLHFSGNNTLFLITIRLCLSTLLLLLLIIIIV